jgi:hypothetical protein
MHLRSRHPGARREPALLFRATDNPQVIFPAKAGTRLPPLFRVTDHPSNRHPGEGRDPALAVVSRYRPSLESSSRRRPGPSSRRCFALPTISPIVIPAKAGTQLSPLFRVTDHPSSRHPGEGRDPAPAVVSRYRPSLKSSSRRRPGPGSRRCFALPTIPRVVIPAKAGTQLPPLLRVTDHPSNRHPSKAGTQLTPLFRVTHNPSGRHPGEGRDPAPAVVSRYPQPLRSSSRRRPGPSSRRCFALATIPRVVIPAKAGTQLSPLFRVSDHP